MTKSWHHIRSLYSPYESRRVMVLLSYIFITVWVSFWVGLMYTQPHRTKREKIIHIAGWFVFSVVVNQLIDRIGIHLLPDEIDPMTHAVHVMYLYSFSTLMTGLILLIGFLVFRRR